MKTLFIFLALVFSSTVFAVGTAVGTANPVIGYLNMKGQPSQAIFSSGLPIPGTQGAFEAQHAAMLGSPNVTTQNMGPVTPTNASGYVPRIGSTGEPVITASETFTVTPPAGSPASVSDIAAATGLAGGLALASGIVNSDITLGSGAGSLLNNLAMPGLGFAVSGAAALQAGFACVAGACPVLGSLAVAGGLAISGKYLYDAIVAQGVSIDSSGSVFKQSSPLSGYAVSASPAAYFDYYAPTLFFKASTTSAACHLAAATKWPGWGDVFIDGGVGGICTDRNGSFVGYIYSYSVPSKSAPVPASNDEISAAVSAAIAGNANAALEAATIAIKNGVNVQDAINASSAKATVDAIHLQSAFTQLSKSIDSLGNTQTVLARNTLDVPAYTPSNGCANNDPTAIANRGACAPVQSTQTVPIVNSVPQSVNSVSTAPIIAANAAAITQAAGQQQSAAKDLCLDHPEILACADITKLKDLPDVKIPNTDKDISVLTPVNLGSAGVCPPPLVIANLMGGGSISLDLAKPICQFATSIRAINLICGTLASFWIISLGFKQNG